MKKILIILVFILLSCNACSNNAVKHNYIFKGESRLWRAEFNVKEQFKETTENGRLSYKTESNSKFILTYKGDLSELRSVKKMIYAYDKSNGSSKTEIEFTSPPDNKVFTSIDRGKSNSLNPDEAIKVTVDLDGKIEVFELKRS